MTKKVIGALDWCSRYVIYFVRSLHSGLLRRNDKKLLNLTKLGDRNYGGNLGVKVAGIGWGFVFNGLDVIKLRICWGGLVLITF
jgi:hypothetical protein